MHGRAARAVRGALVALAAGLAAGPAPARDAEAELAAGIERLRAGEAAAAESAFAAVTEREPENGRAWYLLGYARHVRERWADAVTGYLRAEALGFDPSGTPYNLACAHARAGDAEAALRWLETAARRGFRDVETLSTDADLASLRDRPELVPIVARVARNADPCGGPEHARLDFWLGDWTVTNRGQLQGTNRLEKVSEGCAILEIWTSGAGVEGRSLNWFDPADGLWRQTWVGGFGTIREYVEAPCGETPCEIRFVAERATEEGAIERHRMTLSVLEGGIVRQLGELSTDGGTTWSVVWDGRYTRAEGEAAP